MKRLFVKANSITANYASFLAKHLSLLISVKMQENLQAGMF